MIAFGEEQETTRGFEIERTPARAERADHDGARRIERLLGRPQTFLAFGGADENETAGIEPELREPGWVRSAILGEHTLLARPDHAGLTCPAGREAQTEAQSSCLRARAGRTQLMQRLGGHCGGQCFKSPSPRGEWAGGGVKLGLRDIAPNRLSLGK